MKAFVSYSVSDNNEFILTLLSSKLREKKFIITTSQNFYGNIIDFNTMNEISSSNLFVGVITGMGNERNRVIEELNYAIQRNIPHLLLIEDTVPALQQFKGNYVKFNRNKPQSAIDEITKKMSYTNTTSKSSDDIVPWILGGAALLAIISLLSKENVKLNKI